MALATKPKPNTHHRKRRAQHHKHSKDYIKTYWPYLPMLVIAIFGLVINSFWTANTQVLGVATDLTSQTLLESSNNARTSNHKSSLQIDEQLTNAAAAKAADMVKRDYWSHNAPDGKTPWTFIDASGYTYEKAGENLAYGFADANAAVSGWLNSEEHRANLLSSDYSHVGFGIAHSPNFQGDGPTTVVVAIYARPMQAVSNIRFTVPGPRHKLPNKILGAATEVQPASKNVSRIEVLTGGQAPWSMAALSILAVASMFIFLTRHGLRIRKLLIRGEVFVMHHPIFDLVIVTIATAGFILTRTSGVIR